MIDIITPNGIWRVRSRIDGIFHCIHRGELQTLPDDAVVIVDQWTIREQGFSLGKGLVRIISQNALIG